MPPTTMRPTRYTARAIEPPPIGTVTGAAFGVVEGVDVEDVDVEDVEVEGVETEGVEVWPWSVCSLLVGDKV